MLNLYKYENHVRLILGIIMLIWAAQAQMILLGVMAIMLIYTGAIHYCPVFHLMGINRERGRQDYLLSLLPGQNPEPVYLFNKSGELVFRNGAAKNILPTLRSLGDLQQQNDLTDFRPGKDQSLAGFTDDKSSYMLNYKPIAGTELIAAFGFNVSELIEANEEIVNTQKELLYHMGEIGETRSKETGSHVKRVAEYSRLLALMAGLGKDEAEMLKMASPMHDIGKVAIPDAVLLKPGKLDEEEWAIMKTHASIGHDLLSHSDRPILKAAAVVAGQHHEKWDGSGYPAGLEGENIHIYGRITAVADVFDALASERVYKHAWPLEKILALLKEQSGKHFDPQLVKLLLDNLPQFLDIRDAHCDVPGEQS